MITTVEPGLRLRLKCAEFAPVGIGYEAKTETADIARANGEDVGQLVVIDCVRF